MNSATDMGGNRTCIYLYVGLKAGNNICKWKIFELRKKKVHYVETLRKHTQPHTRTHVVRVLITVGVFILMLI